MILVDTNVWSELLKPESHQPVIDWLDAQGERMALSSIVFGELQFFVQKQTEGRRKQAMHEILAAIRVRTGDSFLGFGEREAEVYGALMTRMRRAGTPIPLIDGWVAAQALANGHSVATRDIGDFRPTGIDLINPWET